MKFVHFRKLPEANVMKQFGNVHSNICSDEEREQLIQTIEREQPIQEITKREKERERKQERRERQIDRQTDRSEKRKDRQAR